MLSVQGRQNKMALTSDFLNFKTLFVCLFYVLLDVLFVLQTFGTAHPNLCQILKALCSSVCEHMP